MSSEVNPKYRPKPVLAKRRTLLTMPFQSDTWILPSPAISSMRFTVTKEEKTHLGRLEKDVQDQRFHQVGWGC
jgi:hypothetical protein